MAKLFLEVIAAPAFDDGAKAAFAAKKNLRLVEVPAGQQNWVLKNISGGMLVQDSDLHKLAESDLKVVTERPPTAEEKRALLFAWKVCKHVKSNAILYARDGQTVGVGAGQMSRVDACKLGAMKAQLPLKGDRQSGGYCDYPAGGFGARSGGHRGRGPAGTGHDLHWRAALQTLVFTLFDNTGRKPVYLRLHIRRTLSAHRKARRM
jgi:hypothetical protein